MKKNKQYCPKCGADLCVRDNISEFWVETDEIHYHYWCTKCGNEVVLTKKERKDERH